MNSLNRSVSGIDGVPVQSCSQKSEKEVWSNGTPFAWQRVRIFWANWNKEAQERSFLCAQNRIDWGAVERSLKRSNSLLATSPDARWQKIARLPKLLADTPLPTAQIVIYAMLGPWSPYVGQLGAIVAPRVAPLLRRMDRVCVCVRSWLPNWRGPT